MPYKYCLVIQPGGEETPRHLEAGVYQVGASASADITLDQTTVSRVHAQIEIFANGGAAIRDMGSTNGTRVNGDPIQSLAVAEGCELMFGSVLARLLPLTGDNANIALRGASTDRVADSATHETAVTATAAGQTARAALSAVALALSAGRPIREVVADVLNTWAKILPVDGLCVRQGDHTLVAQAGNCDAPEDEKRLTQGEYSLTLFGSTDRLPSSLRGPGQMLLMMLAEHPSDPEPKEGAHGVPDYPGVATLNPILRKTLGECARVARGNIPILIHGESGSGKELLARWVHQCSSRAEKAFRAVNCAAVPENLLEAELFGVAKGAATGVDARDGVFAQASGGSLFLDEIGDMSGDVQVRLLRAIEEGLIWPVGSQVPVEVNVRIVAATHHDLHQLVADGQFRLDLLHRLTGYEAPLPPLRERIEDIPALVTHFFNQALSDSDKSSPGITTGALSRMMAWSWPGNVRELRNEIQRAVLLLDDGEPLEESRLSPRLQQLPLDESQLNLEVVVRQAERRAFATALSCAEGNANEAMALLGLSRSSYYRKLKDLGLEANDCEVDSTG